MSWARALTPIDFAPGVPREHRGFIDWGRDTQLRKQWFVPDAMVHPAKADINMLMDIVRYVSKEGDLILDPFGGIGSLLMATLEGRHVALIETEDMYHELEKSSWQIIEESATGKAIFFKGDCRLVMPITCDHIITSPPYSNVLENPDSGDRIVLAEGGTKGALLSAYANRSPANMGALNPFFYNQQMVKVYRLMVQSVRVGGSITIIIKDFISGGKRIYLSEWVEKILTSMGLQLWFWSKRRTRGILSNVRASQGLLAIDDEDIMVFRRVQ